MADLSSLRASINFVDEKLEELLIERMGLVKEVAKAKLDTKMPISDPKREAIILKAMKGRVPSEYEPYVEDLFKTMFKISCKYQRKIIADSKKRSKKHA